MGIWSYSEEITGEGKKRDRRYWNAFGDGKPKDKSNVAIDCEINIPVRGIHRGTAGAFAKSDSGNVALVHRGNKIRGITKAAFEAHYQGEWIEVKDGALKSKVAFVGELDADNFAELVRDFVIEVERIKLALKNHEPERVDTLDDLAALEERYKDATPGIKRIISKRIERGTIARKVKKLTNYKCLVCEVLGADPYSFKKLNGEYFIEAHHVMPVSKLKVGSLGVSNIITVCANHHRQLHYGDVEVVKDSNDVFIIRIDSKTIEIKKVKIKVT